MVFVEVTETSKALGVLGFYVCVLGLGSYVVRERLFLSDSLLATVVGIIVGPVGCKWIVPANWVDNDPERLNDMVFQVVRIVIGIQVLCSGITLPKAYLRKEALSLFILLVPVMTIAWFISGLIIYLLIPSLTYLEALAIAACVTPTDPVLANSIVKGRYAEKHVPVSVRNIISAESGANDGLGFPFIYLAIFLIKRKDNGSTIAGVMRSWVVDVWLYDLFLSIAMGALIGYIARVSLKQAEKRKLIDHENFIAYGFGLAFFTLFCVGIIGSDDILACFVCGNAFTWDDWFRVETQDHAFQDVLDSIVNTAVFIFIGTLEPFSRFGSPVDSFSPWRLVVIALLILLFRRLPAVAVFYKAIPALEDLQQGLFTGWFGPIGVSAIYYLIVLLEQAPASREHLHRAAGPVVYCVILGSVLVHGCTIPMYKMSSAVRRTMTKTNTINSFRIGGTIPQTPTLPGTPGTPAETPTKQLGGQRSSPPPEHEFSAEPSTTTDDIP